MPSAINGEEILYFASGERTKRALISTGVIGVIILVVIGVVISLFILRLVMVKSKLTAGGVLLGPIITSIIQAIVIVVLNIVYQMIATYLNDLENHRTDTAYEDNLIAKVFIFQFVNSYAALFYIAFVKPYIQDFDPCLNGDCMKELQTTLGALFITRLASGIILSSALPIVFQTLRERENFEGVDEEKMKQVSEVKQKTNLDIFTSLHFCTLCFVV